MFLISNSTCLMPVYGKEIDFCKLTLYPINLLWSLINSRSFWLILPEFYIDEFVILEQRNFISFLLISIAFFSWFITLARISSTNLKKGDKRGHPDLFPVDHFWTTFVHLKVFMVILELRPYVMPKCDTILAKLQLWMWVNMSFYTCLLIVCVALKIIYPSWASILLYITWK